MALLFNTAVYLLIVPLALYFSMLWLDRRYHIGGDKRLLVLACLMFSLSMFYPSPRINGQDTQFMTHLIGGGMMVGVLWLYCIHRLQHFKWWQHAILLYAAVSALGVLNELYELWAFESGLTHIPLTDTSWDLLANTLGASIIFIGYLMMKTLFKQR
ncbi:MAG: hypothetical protein WAW60_01730 [Candidatus Saccharimonadales bacterium]